MKKIKEYDEILEQMAIDDIYKLKENNSLIKRLINLI